MFGGYGRARTTSSLTFVSHAFMQKKQQEHLQISKKCVAVEDTRSQISKSSMIRNNAMPDLRIDPETYAVTADGVLLTCEPADVLPMAQRYFLY